MLSPTLSLYVPRRKPTERPQLNRQHPLVRGLQFGLFAAHGAGPSFDLVNGYVLTPNGGAVWSAGPEGVLLSLPSASSSYVVTSSAPPDTNYLGPLSIVYRGRVNSGSAYRAFVGKTSGNGATANPFDFRTTNDPTPKLALVRANTAFSEIDGPAITLNQIQTYGVTTNSSNVANNAGTLFYVDGVQSSFSAASGSGSGAPTGGGNNIQIGRRPDGAVQMDGTCEMVLIWNRVLSADEMAWLVHEPFTLIRESPQQASWFTIVTASSPALSAGTLTLGATGTTSQALSIATDTGGTPPYSNQLQRAPDVSGAPGTWANVGSAVSGATASFTDTGLTPGTKYWWRVVVTDSAGSPATVNSNQVTTTIPSITVSAPSPAALVANTTGYTVSLVGTGTSWTSGTTFSVAGLTGAAVTAKTFIDATHYTLTMTSSTVNQSGTLTITDSTDAAQATVSVYSTTTGLPASRQISRMRV